MAHCDRARPDGTWCNKGWKARAKRLGPTLFMLAIFCIGAFGQAQYGHSGPALLADPSVTPGAVRITSKATVCTVKWGKDERHVTQKMKDEVFAAYGTAQGKGVCAFETRTTPKGKRVKEGCEIDHSISRELGGADVFSNLWPQPYTLHPGGAREKDWLENRLHKAVCAGDITLDQAQKQISTDWYSVYKQYLKLPR